MAGESGQGGVEPLPRSFREVALCSPQGVNVPPVLAIAVVDMYTTT